MTLFSLVGQQLKLDTLEQTQPYLDLLRDIPDLKEVRFGGNTLGVAACEAIAKALEDKHQLEVRPLPPPPLREALQADRALVHVQQTADFSDVFTGRLISEIPQCLRALCTSLLTLPNLTSLDLSDNAFGGRSAEPMCVVSSIERLLPCFAAPQLTPSPPPPRLPLSRSCTLAGSSSSAMRPRSRSSSSTTTAWDRRAAP